MSSHYEVSLQQGLERIREKVAEMGALCERALRDAVRALKERNRQLAYSVIIRDQRVDELEKEVDRLCLEFLVRQQPVGAPLRFAYSTIRVNLELERVGDYAESIARQVIKLTRREAVVPVERFAELSERAIQTLHDAIEAYVKQDATRAREVEQLEEVVDALKSRVNADLIQLFRDQQIPLEVLHPLMTIARRLERVSDQARSIGIEVLYLCTGEDTKHPGSDVYRMLFVDEHDETRAMMAAAIGNSLQPAGFAFDSAGLGKHPPDAALIEFMRGKGADLSRVAPKGLSQVPHLDEQDVIVALSPDVKRLFAQLPRKAVFLDWTIPSAAATGGNAAPTPAAYEQTYQAIREHLKELVDAIAGNDKP
jgi:phosphate transport system protein